MARRDAEKAVAPMARGGVRGQDGACAQAPGAGASKVGLGVIEGEGEGAIVSDFDSVAADEIADPFERVEDGHPQ